MVEMWNHLQEMTELVRREDAGRAQQKQKKAHDHRAKPWSLDVGDQVLMLLPRPWNCLKLEWVGPYAVIRELTSVDYEVKPQADGVKRRSIVSISSRSGIQLSRIHPQTAWQYLGEVEIPVTGMQEEDERYPSGGGSAVNLKDVASGLTAQQQQQLQGLMEEFPAIFQEMPGRTKLTEIGQMWEMLLPSARSPIVSHIYPKGGG